VSTAADCQVAVARPYGLSVAAHLRDGKIEVRIFGDSASFWRDDMPKHESFARPGARHASPKSGNVA
jgi:hypothetical protein